MVLHKIARNKLHFAQNIARNKKPILSEIHLR